MTLTQALIGFAGIAFLITIIPATDTALVLRSLVAGGAAKRLRLRLWHHRRPAHLGHHRRNRLSRAHGSRSPDL